MKFFLKGIEFDISYFFVVFFTIYIAIDRTGMVLPLLLTFAIHEAGHIVFILCFGSSIKKISMQIGCFGIIYEENLSTAEKVISVAAGPLFNIATGITCLFLENKYFSALNFVVAFYNLIPIDGMDGGTLVKIILGRFVKEQTVRYTMVAINVTLIIVVLVLFVSTVILGYKSYMLLLFSIYLSTPLILKNLLKDRQN